jgi:hypothetical protein
MHLTAELETDDYYRGGYKYVSGPYKGYKGTDELRREDHSDGAHTNLRNSRREVHHPARQPPFSYARECRAEIACKSRRDPATYKMFAPS